ncbi:SNF2 family N-terminal domain-containing protein [Talaromyces proteolyticus]|uniref:SNF2 family N-terminal domain-containing protein n=1 Tax=Talaromyces proteolyticus TaxID=1131652 RepID=A0AAD4KY96_9EURO|nr:SNF2 family N-terminal domain-containing protein [Talaromyces proteolyticus]KAH8703147.1 SNF2 family N-terminal domain-containing protein [Talaromyces proteolyticus]
MASSPNAMSTEDILEDLELHQALLESLLEARPGAEEDRMELESTIRALRRQLDQRRGLAPRLSPQPHPTVRLQSTFDGAGDDRMPSSPFASISNELDPELQAQYIAGQPPGPVYPTSSSHPTPHRNHPNPTLLYASSPATDHMYSRESGPSTPGAASTHSFSLGDEGLDDDDTQLHRLLGLEDVDSFAEGQYEAENWLKDRHEQERKDEELARRLQEQWNQDSLYSSTNSSTPAPAPSNMPGFSTNPPAAFRQESYRALSHDHNQVSPGQASTIGSSRVALPFHQRQPSLAPSPFSSSRNMETMETPMWRDTAPTANDSSDSDIAEISPQDFRRSMSAVPVPRSSQSYRSVHVEGPNNRHTMYPTQWPSALAASHRSSSTSQESPIKIPDAYTQALRAARSLGDVRNLGAVGAFLDRTGTGDRASLFPSLSRPGDPDFLDNKQANQELKQMLENLRPDVDLTKDKWEGTPTELRYALLDHQKVGVAWMKSMEEGTNKGGILADDMGLGKTMQAIALMVSRPSSDDTRKTTLIVAPVALMQQWKREIERMVRPEHKLNVFILHGEKRKTTFAKLRKYDVVLTTFGTLGSELKRKEEWDNNRRFAGQSSANIVGEAQSLPLLGPESTWYRVIIDEAQCIKNRNTKSSLACCSLNSTHRWCMSGTPMMNSVAELHSLLRFLRIRPYNSLELFNKDFTRPLKSNVPTAQQKALQQLQVVLKAVLLRRTKYSKIDGKPILNLPPRVTEKVHASFSEDELSLYKGLETNTQIQFNRYLEAGSIGRNYSNILVLLLRLRQACCHPHLINDLSVDVSAVTENVDLVENAKQFDVDVIRRLKENEPLECPVCIDAVENAVIFYPCGHATCAECFARISDPSLAIQQGHDGQVEAKCPNCRARIDPKKVTDNVSFKKVHFPTEGSEADEPSEIPTNDDETADSDSDSDESDDDSDEDSDLAEFIVPDDYDSDEKRESKKRVIKRKRKGKGKPPKKAKKPKKTLAVLKKEAQKNAAAKRKYLRRIEKNWETSAKIDKALEILEKLKGEGQGEKTIIFSQFTSLLDLLEVPISRKGWKYRRYDGSMRPSERNDSVLEFTDNPECDIMLVSLKAGNAGLNLVAASQVIIFDPFWNPYIEEQAIDRAHRLGQLRPVQIHHLLIQNTVEDRILALQDKKRELIEGALDENAAKQISRLGIRELKFLFNVN